MCSKRWAKPLRLVRIILRPDVIPDLDRDRRAGMILHRVNLQSVRQSLVLELQWRHRDRWFRGLRISCVNDRKGRDEERGEGEK